ncbi:Uncharacterised protein [Mycobacteroides abscessus subsp. abscessus]|mgnify:CR=1 FL=1|uniref:hypothetical protein n=1 Tax=Brevibacterium casei TaxID=33889 RepID=UPI0009273932|nr:hypothetical protein [Brevibacterium casei]MCT2357908.1 hypothetical protein [Brevibacterium casei]MDH5149937.1 hypothetical protein [Brevibacterium casei]SII19169.1 Uncharacterised protein [Mycobacteroides abscessus subsp. abscessus]
MRLPDIPARHRLLVRTVSTIGSGALSIVRRRDFAAEHQNTARAAYAVATAAMTWLGGTRAFADTDVDLVAPGGAEAGEPARYAEDEPFGYVDGGDPEAWWIEDATWRSRAFLNLAAAAAAGAASWMLWGPIQNLKDSWDEKLPDGLGRGLGAVINSSVVAATAFAVDRAEEFVAREALDGHIDVAPVEIELPAHVRASLDALLDEPHPQSQDVAEVIRAQLDHGRFFITVPYSRKQFPGDDPIELSDADLSALLAEEDVSSIDVYLDAEAPRAIPANHTYPVSALFERDADRSGSSADPALYELSLDIRDGLLDRIDLYGVDAELDAEVAAMTADNLGASAPGTLHPEGIEGWVEPDLIDGEDVDDADLAAVSIEAPLTLADWPAPEDLTFRTDGA